MGATVIRRQVRRYFGSVIKTARGDRWIGQLPWGECYRVFWCTLADHVKAIEGAEKSCHSRRRKRGLRRGKPRSREGKSRRSAPLRPPDPNSVSSRKIRRVVEQIDYWDEKTEPFLKRLEFYKDVSFWFRERETKKGTCWEPTPRYFAARNRWNGYLHSMKRGSRGLILRSFATVLAKRTGVIVPSATSVRVDLERWLEDYEWMRDAREEMEIDPLSFDWRIFQRKKPIPSGTYERRGGVKQPAGRSESTKFGRKFPTSSRPGGKPKGKRLCRCESPRGAVVCRMCGHARG